MANPSETYAVDSTLTFGTTEVNLTKKLSTLYPTVNTEIDNSISINKFNDDLVKTVYRKSDKYNSLFDNSITFGASPAGGNNVVKYYARNGFPTDSVNITNAIVYGANPENRVYSTGYNGDAGSVYNANSAGDLKFIRDLEYNKILFAITAKEYSSIPVLAKGTIDYDHGSHEVPSTTNVDLKDIDPNKYYMGYDSIAAKVWNGSDWSDIQAHPILVCNGETVQSIQSAGTAFYSEMDNYGMIMGSGQNISISVSSTNQMNNGYNFCNAMDRAKYTLGWSDSYSAAPNWIDIKDNIFQQINQHMIDNNQNNMSCTISREIISVSDNMSMLVSVVGQFYRNNNGIYNASMSTMMYPILKGSALLKLLAGFGCYYRADSSLDISALTPDTLHNSSDIWLGAMSADGTTTGNWIKGSDIENYTGYNKDGNIINPNYNPSGGGGGGDDDDPSDDQAWGGAYSGAGAFSKFYLCTSTDLANLRTWFGGGGSGDQIPDNFDPMGQVLGLLQYPVSIAGTALAPEEIVFRSGKTIVHTNVNATRSTGGFLHIDCGSVDIPRRMQERGVPFLDFETTLEIYVPFCGTAPLDVQTCVGKTLTCDLYVATATGDVSAVIAAGGHPVAYMSGNMAESLPISSGGYGMYLAACKNAWSNGVTQVMNQLTGGTTDTMKNVNQAALNETLSYNQTGGWGHSELIRESYNNPHVGSAMAAAASPMGAAAIGLIKTGLNVMNAATTGYEHYQHVKNASYTSVSGSFTSCAAWNYPFTPYVKITRPHKQIPTGGKGDYKHTSAIPLVETRNLSGAPGLTTCVNPDVSGIANATAQEKDIIYRALVNGVIV